MPWRASALLLITISMTQVAQARDPVKTRIAIPDTSTTSYSKYAQICVNGTVNVPTDEKVKIRVYAKLHEQPPWRKIIGTSQFSKGGQFVFEIEPPTGGWPVGELRIEARPEHWFLASDFVDVTIVDTQTAPVRSPGETPLGRPVVELDLAKLPDQPPRILQNQGAVIRGSYVVPDGPELGPADVVSIFCGGQFHGGIQALRDGESRRYDLELHYSTTYETGLQTYVLYRGIEQAEDKKIGEFRLHIDEPGKQEQAAVPAPPPNDAIGTTDEASVGLAASE